MTTEPNADAAAQSTNALRECGRLAYVEDGLKCRTVIVTGAGAQTFDIEIGRAAAVLLARAGARVVAVDLTADRLEESVDLIEQVGGDCLPVEADVTYADACKGVADAARKRFGGVDALINDVRIAGPVKNVVDLDVAEWKRCVDINLTSVILMSKFTIPRMRRAGHGAIVTSHLSAKPSAIHALSATRQRVRSRQHPVEFPQHLCAGCFTALLTEVAAPEHQARRETVMASTPKSAQGAPESSHSPR